MSFINTHLMIINALTEHVLPMQFVILHQKERLNILNIQVFVNSQNTFKVKFEYLNMILNTWQFIILLFSKLSDIALYTLKDEIYIL